MVGEDKIGIGSVIGGFKIEKELGRGGMGVVYKGHELSLNRKVALKVLSQRLCSDEEFIKRFKREAQVIAALNHPNIVNILSYGEEHGLYYFAMEYVRGKDLGQILKEKGSIPLKEALAIASQVASALAEAGPRGVVHRDLKPSNIMVDELGRAKVTDFGVAHFQDSESKLTQTGLFLGTPEYASPEQATGRPLDVRSDIYALGAVLYRMLSGRPPITGESPLAVVTKIATEPVTPIGQVNTALPEGVCRLIDKMMAKDAAARFQTPEEVVNSIERCMKELDMDVPFAKAPAAAPIVPPPPPRVKSGVRLWGGIAGVALAVLLVVWFVEGGFLREKPAGESPMQSSVESPVQRPAESPVESPVAGPAESPVAGPVEKEPTAEPSSRQDASGVNAQVDVAPQPPAPQVQQQKISPVEKPVAALTATKKKATLPKIPTVLMLVTGDEGMAGLIQTHLESAIGHKGLRIAPISDVPTLEKKMHLGDMPITWYSVQQLVPKGKAQIMVLAQVQKTGSMNLQYYGQTQQLTTATFSVKAVDMDTGTSAAKPASGSIKFTALNMETNIQKAVSAATQDMAAQIRAYWEKKLKGTGEAG
jgi:serine/threonine protein kinase